MKLDEWMDGWTDGLMEKDGLEKAVNNIFFIFFWGG
jgi:hypothetical protein